MTDFDEQTATRRHMRTAARLALRGHGGAEPNPMVGCVIVSLTGDVVGEGYHRQCGHEHAEIIALRRAGRRAEGGTCYLTLEPCNHTGRTPPCTEALIDAGIARVVIARRDPHPAAGGGVERLLAAGVEVEFDERCRGAIEVSDPFVHRVRTGLPWMIAKWAQTLDGRIATRTGNSKWISGDVSRRMVHRERGRVDAILTGIGTVLADDPMLTARHVRVRRVARRIVIDPQLRIPLDSQLARTASLVPCTVLHNADGDADRKAKINSLREAGVECLPIPCVDETLVLRDALRSLAERYDLTHVLVEAGCGLLSSLLRERLINEMWVFIGSKFLGDSEAMAPFANIPGGASTSIDDALSIELRDVRQRGNDVMLRYRMGRDGGTKSEF